MMMLFPALAIAGHLFATAVAQTAAQARVPDLNYEQICRDSAGAELGLKDDRAICMQDEAAARAELTQKWGQFSAGGRASCLRLSSQKGAGSYVEMLTCLEMDRDARALTKSANLGIVAIEPSPERDGDPVRTGQVQRRPPPVAVAAPEASPPSGLATPSIPTPGFLWVFCPPGLSGHLPNCPLQGALPR